MLSRQFYFNLNDDLIVDLFAGGGGALVRANYGIEENIKIA